MPQPAGGMLIAFGLSFLTALLLGYWAARQPVATSMFGDGSLAVVWLGLVIIGATAVLLLAALVVGVGRHRRGWSLGLAAVAIGIFAGFLVGIRL